MESEYRRKGKRLRPFRDSAEVSSRGCSIPLQRAVVDFGSDHAFASVVGKLEEHYGISLPSSTIRNITERHGERMCEQVKRDKPEVEGCETLILETDGSMIPIVFTDEKAEDKRKGKKEVWKEVKLCLAHPQGKVNPYFGVSFQEGVEQAGKMMFDTACLAGFGRQTYVHSVGDGATWISEQVEAQFGTQGHYLVDFYHVCEYLSEAAANDCLGANWLETQKAALKQHGDVQAVLDELSPHLESQDLANDKAPVRACYRYLNNRNHQLNYPQAISKNLPIGSGEIESAHRYVIQQRLKLSGAWWNPDNARAMLALRTMRANGLWQQYWLDFEQGQKIAA